MPQTDNLSLDNKGKDYSTGGSISSAEELEAYLKDGNNAPPEEGNDNDEGKGGKEGEETNNNRSGGEENRQGGEASAGKNKGEEGKEEGNKEDDEQEFPTTLHYLNENLKLGLNLSQVPKDLDRGQEAEAIAEVMRRVQQGYSNSIQRYQHIDETLKDPEVKAFVQAKLEGKSMKDYVQEYSSSAQGLPQEQVTANYVKRLNPGLTPEEVTEMVATFKEKGKLEKLEADARKYFQDEEARNVTLKEQKEREEATQALENRRQETIQFAQYLKGIKDVSGVQLDDKMRREVFQAATTIVDQKSGRTWLDQALMTDEGVLLATLGIIHMKKLLSGRDTTQVNQKHQRFVDSIFDSPDPLQSSSESKGGRNKDAEIIIANSF